jgi:hypothetical protein
MMKDVTSEVLVFKTNIYQWRDIDKISEIMKGDSRIVRWNIDREDVDNVLRVEADHVTSTEIQILINAAGFSCEELPD